jgi:hypothetical protein
MNAMRGLASHSSQSPHRLRERFEIDLLLEMNDDARFNLPLPGRLACVALIGSSADALAQSHPLTSRMSCAQARVLVAAQGSIVLSTSSLTYERYARGNGDCVLGETTEPAWVPTVDTAQCPIAYHRATRKVPSRNWSDSMLSKRSTAPFPVRVASAIDGRLLSRRPGPLNFVLVKAASHVGTDARFQIARKLITARCIAILHGETLIGLGIVECLLRAVIRPRLIAAVSSVCPDRILDRCPFEAGVRALALILAAIGAHARIAARLSLDCAEPSQVDCSGQDRSGHRFIRKRYGSG